MNIKSAIKCTGIIAAFGFAMTAKAIPYSFVNFSNHSGIAASVIPQLSVDVTSVDATHVNFYFTNAVGGISSSITDIYFEDAGQKLFVSPLTQANFTQPSGVSYSQGANPPNIPDSQNVTPHFQASAGISSDSNEPNIAKGINPGEWLSITFTLLPGINFNTVLNQLNQPRADNRLRIAIKVQKIGGPNGDGDSYIDVPQRSSVPDGGATAALVGLGLLAMGAARRRFASK